jgi:hypothetical protein
MQERSVDNASAGNTLPLTLIDFIDFIPQFLAEVVCCIPPQLMYRISKFFCSVVQ